MYNKNFKLLLALLSLIYSTFQFINSNIGNGISLILLAGLFVFLYYKNEFILLAFLRMRKQDITGTSKWLNRIKKPERALTIKQQGYYNYMKGLVSSQSNLAEAEKFLRKALSLGLSMKHDIAMAKLSLAGICMQKRRKREATTFLNEAKKLDKHRMLAEQIKLMQTQLKKI